MFHCHMEYPHHQNKTYKNKTSFEHAEKFYPVQHFWFDENHMCPPLSMHSTNPPSWHELFSLHKNNVRLLSLHHHKLDVVGQSSVSSRTQHHWHFGAKLNQVKFVQVSIPISHELLHHHSGLYHDRNHNGSIAWNIPLAIPHSLLVMDSEQQNKKGFWHTNCKAQPSKKIIRWIGNIKPWNPNGVWSSVGWKGYHRLCHHSCRNGSLSRSWMTC